MSSIKFTPRVSLRSTFGIRISYPDLSAKEMLCSFFDHLITAGIIKVNEFDPDEDVTTFELVEYANDIFGRGILSEEMGDDEVNVDVAGKYIYFGYNNYGLKDNSAWVVNHNILNEFLNMHKKLVSIAGLDVTLGFFSFIETEDCYASSS